MPTKPPGPRFRVHAYVPAEAQELLDDVARRRQAQTGYAAPAAELWREAIMRGLALMRDDLPAAALPEA